LLQLKALGKPVYLTRTAADMQLVAEWEPALADVADQFHKLQHKRVAELAGDESVRAAMLGIATRCGNGTGLRIQLDAVSPGQHEQKQQQHPGHWDQAQELGRATEDLVTELIAPASRVVTTLARIYDPAVAPECRDMRLYDVSSGKWSQACLKVVLRPHSDAMSWLSSGHEVQLGRHPAIKAGLKLHGESIFLLVVMDASTQLPIAAVGIPMGPGDMYLMTGTLATGMPGRGQFWLHAVVCMGETQG